MKTIYDSPVGQFLLAADSQGITAITKAGDGFTSTPDDASEEAGRHLADAIRWLDGYFAGEIPASMPALHLTGTAFQMQVWEQLLKVPYGATSTYGAIAKAVATSMGKARMSAQAVGQAVGANPVCIIVPCHRIIGSDGSLTGYAYGLEMKTALLRIEKIIL